MINEYQAKYYSYELSKRCSSDSAEKFGATLLDAKVDLNPHQVEAALFAFKSPLSKGAILADEVGLGKTIEAGILLSQKWAEGKRRILIISPSSLRKQWSQELADKCFAPSQRHRTPRPCSGILRTTSASHLRGPPSQPVQILPSHS